MRKYLGRFYVWAPRPRGSMKPIFLLFWTLFVFLAILWRNQTDGVALAAIMTLRYFVCCVLATVVASLLIGPYTKPEMTQEQFREKLRFRPRKHKP